MAASPRGLAGDPSEGADRTAIMIVNPAAGRGRAEAKAGAVERALRRRGAEIDVRQGDTAADTRRLVEQAVAERPDVLVIAGGDGTISAVLDLLADAPVPLAVVPGGTGNDFAAALELPQDPERLADTILRGLPRAVDLGVVRSDRGSRLFLTVAACGFDAKVAARTNRLRWPRGALRYYLALALELIRLAPQRYRVTDEQGDREAPGTLLALCNTRCYGGGMPIAPKAIPDDGRLEVVHVAPLGRIRLLRLFPQLLHGTHMMLPEVTAWDTREITVSAPALVVYADGERVAQGSCTVAVRRGALTVLVPVFRR
ncbi:Diacylglycerol kinase [Microbacterium sp. 8M]|uniref:diacylglycerol/lipid kinase family protein n=1 Tax=Microbacterium sp. 8M TaxID=2653153 RepID=UPI0012EFB091|nr:diacylglycerol kinase family protein [Microbacterium sp. 8M]VXC17479.1 Diacylglycerol kinase [Microbacterium sp. 8M]